jgi:hypothetical protein
MYHPKTPWLDIVCTVSSMKIAKELMKEMEEKNNV